MRVASTDKASMALPLPHSGQTQISFVLSFSLQQLFFNPTAYSYGVSNTTRRAALCAISLMLRPELGFKFYTLTTLNKRRAIIEYGQREANLNFSQTLRVF